MRLRLGEVKEAIAGEIKDMYEASMRPPSLSPQTRAASLSGLRSAVTNIGSAIESDDPREFWVSVLDIVDGLRTVAGRAPGPMGVEAGKNFVDALNMAANVAKRQSGRR